MMLHALAARIYLMMADFDVPFCAAQRWVCRRIDKNLQPYYWRTLAVMLDQEGL